MGDRQERNLDEEGKKSQGEENLLQMDHDAIGKSLNAASSLKLSFKREHWAKDAVEEFGNLLSKDTEHSSNDVQLICIAEALAKNSSLTSLDLSCDTYCLHAGPSLAKELQHNTTLTELDLSNSDNRLTKLNLERTNVGDSAVLLIQSLEYNSVLTSLELKVDHLNDNFGSQLAQTLLSNSTLTHIRLPCDDITNRGMSYLLRAMNYNSSVTSFDVTQSLGDFDYYRWNLSRRLAFAASRNLALKEDAANGKHPLYRICIAIVGQKSAGKTTLARLLGADTKYDSTNPCLAQSELSLQHADGSKMKATLWEMRHEALHPILDYSRGPADIYIIVWSVQSDPQAESVRSWLDVIQPEVQERNLQRILPKIVVAVTHADFSTDRPLNYKELIESLSAKYAITFDFQLNQFPNEADVARLKAQITDLAIQCARVPSPFSWEHVLKLVKSYKRAWGEMREIIKHVLILESEGEAELKYSRWPLIQAILFFYQQLGLLVIVPQIQGNNYFDVFLDLQWVRFISLICSRKEEFITGTIDHQTLEKLFYSTITPEKQRGAKLSGAQIGHALQELGLARPLLMPANRIQQIMFLPLLPPTCATAVELLKDRNVEDKIFYAREVDTDGIAMSDDLGQCLTQLWRYVRQDSISREFVILQRDNDIVLIRRAARDRVQIIGIGKSAVVLVCEVTATLIKTLSRFTHTIYWWSYCGECFKSREALEDCERWSKEEVENRCVGAEKKMAWREYAVNEHLKRHAGFRLPCGKCSKEINLFSLSWSMGAILCAYKASKFFGFDEHERRSFEGELRTMLGRFIDYPMHIMASDIDRKKLRELAKAGALKMENFTFIERLGVRPTNVQLGTYNVMWKSSGKTSTQENLNNEGTQSEVYLCTMNPDDNSTPKKLSCKYCVVKIVKRPKNVALQQLEQEVTIMRGVRSPFLATPICYFTASVIRDLLPSKEHSCLDDHSETLFIVLDPFETTMTTFHERLTREGLLNWLEVAPHLLQIMKGLGELQHRRIVHRDIKYANILVDRSLDLVAISDFGCAVQADSNFTISLYDHWLAWGERGSVPPEIEEKFQCINKKLTNKAEDVGLPAEKADIWGVAQMFSKLFLSKFVYTKNSTIELLGETDQKDRLSALDAVKMLEMKLWGGDWRNYHSIQKQHSEPSWREWRTSWVHNLMAYAVRCSQVWKMNDYLRFEFFVTIDEKGFRERVELMLACGIYQKQTSAWKKILEAETEEEERDEKKERRG